MRRNSKWSLPVAFMVVALPMSAGDVQQQELPEGVTAEMVQAGEQVFGTACTTCHGVGGVGTPIGPNLTDAEWLHIDGTYNAIIELVNTGVPAPKQHPIPMMPKGGTDITEDQVRAVAAYVWTLSAE